jgi:indolepyruvate ferredoxin oxidoreductase beta subunit
VASAAPTNVLVVGVGGQGVIMISKVLAEVCRQHDLDVKQSEVHGMAKRGGVVFSHVRFGERIFSPTIPQGEANVLLAMEWAEGLRWLPYLNRDAGTFIADTQRIVPPFACRNRKRGATMAYTQPGVETVREQVTNSFALDATSIATELGNLRASNTVLLGVLSTALDFPVDPWQSIIAATVPERSIEINLRAFERGRQWALEAPEAPVHDDHPVVVPAAERLADEVHWQIEAGWCKGCDICTKVCPERVIRLDDRQIARLTEPDACTGCRICEWLCPDYAITVTVSPTVQEMPG